MRKDGYSKKLTLNRETISLLNLHGVGGGTSYSNRGTSCANISSCADPCTGSGASVGYSNQNTVPLCG
jgi:hypothetical protein